MKKLIKYLIFFIIIILLGYYFWPEKQLDTTKVIDKILVVKNERELILFSNGEAIKTYTISLGQNPEGRKEFEGDKKTPEGIYFINDKNPNSDYHLNLGISYPNEYDKKKALELNKDPGGQIKIHGLKNGFGFIGKFHRFFDWTLGCIALTNKEVEELYNNVKIGTEIEIVEKASR